MLESKDLCFQSQSKCRTHIQYNTILLVPLKTKKATRSNIALHETRPLNKPLVTTRVIQQSSCIFLSLIFDVKSDGVMRYHDVISCRLGMLTSCFLETLNDVCRQDRQQTVKGSKVTNTPQNIIYMYKIYNFTAAQAF